MRRVRSDRMLKSEVRKLRRLLVAFLLQIEAQVHPWAYGREFTVYTVYGKLCIHVWEKEPLGVVSSAIFTCFEEPGRAAKHLDSNPFTGKWNFHFERQTAEDALASFVAALRPILRRAS